MVKISVSSGMLDEPVIMDGYALPPKFTAQWTDAPGPDVTMSLEIIDGRVICGAVTLAATEAHPEVLASDLRNLPLSAMRDNAIQFRAQPVTNVQEHESGMVTMDYAAPTPGDRRGVSAANRRRQKVNEQSLGRVAELYRFDPPGVLSAIEDEFGVARRTAQLWLKRAKDRDLI